MKLIGVVLAGGLFVVILGGIGYGLISGYELLSLQWGSLNDERRSILILIAAMILFSALFVAYMITTVIRWEGSRSLGRVEAYNAFVAWYSKLIGSTDQTPDASSLAPTKNRVMLWGSNRVVRQINLLHEMLAKGDSGTVAVLEKAEHVYLEIKRELGHRSMGVDRSVV